MTIGSSYQPTCWVHSLSAGQPSNSTPSQTSITNVTGPPESIASQSASTALLSSDDGPNNSVLSKVVKMQPGPRKNGCNLCVFCWLKQVSIGGGSTKEFNVYYSQLGTEQIKLYDTEAVHLSNK
ncbi:hypothetical protein BDR05DRAFT_943699 [Suillus weaverae]|nr:hypothetical protein BDR05DRAFT_943699 [Suillus weaverae]